MVLNVDDFFIDLAGGFMVREREKSEFFRRTNYDHVGVIGYRLEGRSLARHLAPVTTGAHQVDRVQHHRALRWVFDLKKIKIFDLLKNLNFWLGVWYIYRVGHRSYYYENLEFSSGLKSGDSATWILDRPIKINFLLGPRGLKTVFLNGNSYFL